MIDKVGPNSKTMWIGKISCQDHRSEYDCSVIIFLPRMVSHERKCWMSWCRLQFPHKWQEEEPECPRVFGPLPSLFLQIYRHISFRWPLWTLCSVSAFPRFEDQTSVYCPESKKWKGTGGVCRNQSCRPGGSPDLVQVLSSRWDDLSGIHVRLSPTF